MDSDKTIEELFRAEFRRLLGRLAPDYDRRYAQLTALRHVAHEEIAQALQPVFDQRLHEMPQSDLESKRQLCSWANDQLKTLGLAVRCEKTGRPGILVANPYRVGDQGGRYRLELRDEGGRMSRSYSGNNLPPLRLMEHSIRREPFAAKYRQTPESDRSR